MAELEALQYHIDKFEELGASVVALCPQLQVYNQSIVADAGLRFPVLRDADNMLSSAFGLTLQQPAEVVAAEQSLGLDLPAHNGTQNWDLPIPARYVIDVNSRVLYTALHVDHRFRTDPLDCVECILAH